MIYLDSSVALECRSVAQDDRLCRPAADGARGRGPERGRLRGEERGAAGSAQRLPRSERETRADTVSCASPGCAKAPISGAFPSRGG